MDLERVRPWQRNKVSARAYRRKMDPLSFTARPDGAPANRALDHIQARVSPAKGSGASDSQGRCTRTVPGISEWDRTALHRAAKKLEKTSDFRNPNPFAGGRKSDCGDGV